MSPHLSRRSLLKYAGGAGAVGLGGQIAQCVAADITSITHRIDEEFPYDEHLVVTVDVDAPIAPAL